MTISGLFPASCQRAPDAAAAGTGATSRMIPSTCPAGYARIKRVSSFQELVTTPLPMASMPCVGKRTLLGDFSEVVQALGVTEGVTRLTKPNCENCQ